MSAHLVANFFEIHAADRTFIDDPTARHHQQTIGELEKLVQIFADQQDGNSSVTSIHNLRVNVIYCRKVQTKTRIGGDQNLWISSEFLVPKWLAGHYPPTGG